jgi:hypothetical protein
VLYCGESQQAVLFPAFQALVLLMPNRIVFSSQKIKTEKKERKKGIVPFFPFFLSILFLWGNPACFLNTQPEPILTFT